MAVSPLPRGPNAAPREVVRESQRGRMLEAMAVAVAERGYASTSVAEVIGRAGVSRKTFYEHFANKEACFLEAYDLGVEVLLGTIESAVEAAPDWLRAVSDGLGAYLETLAANPAFARTFLVEILAAGPQAIERRAAVHGRFAELVAANHRAARADMPELHAVPTHRFRSCVGAIHELVAAHLAAQGAETLPTLLDEIVDVQLALISA
jgi:AcrR family transcriptional regulator